MSGKNKNKRNKVCQRGDYWRFSPTKQKQINWIISFLEINETTENILHVNHFMLNTI